MVYVCMYVNVNFMRLLFQSPFNKNDENEFQTGKLFLSNMVIILADMHMLEIGTAIVLDREIVTVVYFLVVAFLVDQTLQRD